MNQEDSQSFEKFSSQTQEDSALMVPSQAWFSTDLSSPNMKGSWYIGNQTFYSVNDSLSLRFLLSGLNSI